MDTIIKVKHIAWFVGIVAFLLFFSIVFSNIFELKDAGFKIHCAVWDNSADYFFGKLPEGKTLFCHSIDDPTTYFYK